MEKDNIAKLTDKNEKDAYAFMEQIVSESQKTDIWYVCFEQFASLLHHPKSFVRNRALMIIAENVRWDSENRFDAIVNDYLSLVTDEKPITARTCIRSLTKIAKARPDLTKKILDTLEHADLSGYKDSMSPLIRKDIENVIDVLKKQEG